MRLRETTQTGTETILYLSGATCSVAKLHTHTVSYEPEGRMCHSNEWHTRPSGC